MATRSVSKPTDKLTNGREVFEQLALDIGFVQAQADILAMVVRLDDLEGLHEHSLSTVLLNMEQQLGDIKSRVHDQVAASYKQPEEEVNHE